MICFFGDTWKHNMRNLLLQVFNCTDKYGCPSLCKFSTKQQTFDALHMNEFPVMELQIQKQMFADQLPGYNMIAVEFLWGLGKHTFRIGQASPKMNHLLCTHWVYHLTRVCGCTFWNR